MVRRRRWYTPAQLREVWAQWHAGATLEAISEGLALSPTGIYGVVRARGGVRPVAATRSARTLSLVEREVIERGRRAGQSCRALARTLGRAPSTISRSKLSVARRSTCWLMVLVPCGTECRTAGFLIPAVPGRRFNCTPKTQRTTPRLRHTGRHAHRSRHDGLSAGWAGMVQRRRYRSHAAPSPHF